MTFLLYVSILTLVVTVSANYREVRVSQSSCDEQYRVSLGVPIDFIYDGAYIPDPCILSLREDALYGKNICMGITQKGDLCPGITVEYHWHFYTIPDRVINCTTSDTDVYKEFCRKSSTFDLALVDRSDFNWTTPLKIKLYINETEVGDIRNVIPPNMANISVYAIIGIVVGCIVLMIILVVVVVVYCCRRHQLTTGGTVYRSPEMASATTTTQAPPTEMSPMQNMDPPPYPEK